MKILGIIFLVCIGICTLMVILAVVRARTIEEDNLYIYREKSRENARDEATDQKTQP